MYIRAILHKQWHIHQPFLWKKNKITNFSKRSSSDSLYNSDEGKSYHSSYGPELLPQLIENSFPEQLALSNLFFNLNLKLIYSPDVKKV